MMQYSSSPLILPGHPLFHRTTATTVPPDWRHQAESMGQLPNFVVHAETGLMRPANHEELMGYLYEGEYDQRQAAISAQPEVEHWDLDRGLVERW
ncbi:MAG: hypothetical protein F6K00_27110 [Leptolyngbya sp. SIOISBB]|nr:hypothetical protein [Leptolyngbya sp. SIOISBB]